MSDRHTTTGGATNVTFLKTVLAALPHDVRHEVFSHFCCLCGDPLQGPDGAGVNRCPKHPRDEPTLEKLQLIRNHLAMDGAPDAPCVIAHDTHTGHNLTCCDLYSPCFCSCHDRRITYFNELQGKALKAFDELFRV